MQKLLNLNEGDSFLHPKLNTIHTVIGFEVTKKEREKQK